MEKTYHIPIMLNEALTLLRPERGGIFIDGTLGGGGHSAGILSHLPEGSRLFGIDRDDEAILEAGKRLGGDPKFTAVHGNFFDMRALLSPFGISGADGIMLDLGVSSHQLDDGSRGFSYMNEARLDMRMDRSQNISAFDVVNTYPTARLYDIIRYYGEERYASRIADAITRERQASPIETTTRLSEIIKAAMPAAARRESQHPAKRTFQAIRIEVNGELDGLEKAITDAVGFLNPGGVIAVITFHSLEDRVVKRVFKTLHDPCTCPPSAPICTCGKQREIDILTNKPLTAAESELEANPRSRSAKLRAARKLDR
ncbi:MAG: 16S rRNA (cytosine(1402)-N(4))-methyltransferase RsmH [Clostridia bacterium]|nr:16S rRNA (cytosine(1402)-N(4))-methyltransferase RsmH [Clostridia bacterium]